MEESGLLIFLLLSQTLTFVQLKIGSWNITLSPLCWSLFHHTFSCTNNSNSRKQVILKVKQLQFFLSAFGQVIMIGLLSWLLGKKFYKQLIIFFRLETGSVGEVSMSDPYSLLIIRQPQVRIVSACRRQDIMCTLCAKEPKMWSLVSADPTLAKNMVETR